MKKRYFSNKGKRFLIKKSNFTGNNNILPDKLRLRTRYHLLDFDPLFSSLSKDINNTIDISSAPNNYGAKDEEQMDCLISANEIMHKPNVTFSYTGYKTVNGVKTDEKCIVVGVCKKVKKEDLKSDELIPEVVSNGKKTDVIVIPYMKFLNNCNPTIPYRPLMGGISSIRQGGTACTLGAIVKDSTDKRLVALTNNHCAGIVYDPNYDIPDQGFVNTVGDNMLQPSPFDGGTTNDVCGIIKRVVPIKFGAVEPNFVDCAISEIIIDNPLTNIENIGDGPYLLETDESKYGVGTIVKKNGRTTCYTESEIVGKYINTNVSFSNEPGDNNVALFVEQMAIGFNQFSAGGDSGSVIISNIDGQDKIIGLLFAGGQISDTEFITIANHISDVVEYLNVESWQGDIVVEYNKSNQIIINNKTYVRMEDTTDPITHKII